MERKILVSEDDKYNIYNLNIDEEDFNYTKYYINNLPCLFNYLDGRNYESFEDCVSKLNYDYKKNPCELSIYLNKILDNDDPLIISDTVNKLIHFTSNASLEMAVQEGLLAHFSIENNDNSTSMVELDNDSLKELVPVSMNDLKEYLKDRVHITTNTTNIK